MSQHNLDIPVTTTVHAPSSDGVELDELASDEPTPHYPHPTATINATTTKQKKPKHHTNNNDTSQQIRNNNGRLTDPDIPVPSSHLHENDTDLFAEAHPLLEMNLSAVAAVFPPTAPSLPNGASGSNTAIMNKRQQNKQKKRKTDDYSASAASAGGSSNTPVSRSKTSLQLLEAVSLAPSVMKEPAANTSLAPQAKSVTSNSGDQVSTSASTLPLTSSSISAAAQDSSHTMAASQSTRAEASMARRAFTQVAHLISGTSSSSQADLNPESSASVTASQPPNQKDIASQQAVSHSTSHSGNSRTVKTTAPPSSDHPSSSESAFDSESEVDTDKLVNQSQSAKANDQHVIKPLKDQRLTSIQEGHYSTEDDDEDSQVVRNGSEVLLDEEGHSIDSTQVLLSQPRGIVRPTANNKASSSSTTLRASQRKITTSSASQDILPSSRLAFTARQQRARSSQQQYSTRATVEIVTIRASQTSRPPIRQRTPPPPPPTAYHALNDSSSQQQQRQQHSPSRLAGRQIPTSRQIGSSSANKERASQSTQNEQLAHQSKHGKSQAGGVDDDEETEESNDEPEDEDEEIENNPTRRTKADFSTSDDTTRVDHVSSTSGEDFSNATLGNEEEDHDDAEEGVGGGKKGMVDSHSKKKKIAVYKGRISTHNMPRPTSNVKHVARRIAKPVSSQAKVLPPPPHGSDKESSQVPETDGEEEDNDFGNGAGLDLDEEELLSDYDDVPLPPPLAAQVHNKKTAALDRSTRQSVSAKKSNTHSSSDRKVTVAIPSPRRSLRAKETLNTVLPSPHPKRSSRAREHAASASPMRNTTIVPKGASTPAPRRSGRSGKAASAIPSLKVGDRIPKAEFMQLFQRARIAIETGDHVANLTLGSMFLDKFNVFQETQAVENVAETHPNYLKNVTRAWQLFIWCRNRKVAVKQDKTLNGQSSPSKTGGSTSSSSSRANSRNSSAASLNNAQPSTSPHTIENTTGDAGAPPAPAAVQDPPIVMPPEGIYRHARDANCPAQITAHLEPDPNDPRKSYWVIEQASEHCLECISLDMEIGKGMEDITEARNDYFDYWSQHYDNQVQIVIKDTKKFNKAAPFPAGFVPPAAPLATVHEEDRTFDQDFNGHGYNGSGGIGDAEDDQAAAQVVPPRKNGKGESSTTSNEKKSLDRGAASTVNRFGYKRKARDILHDLASGPGDGDPDEVQVPSPDQLYARKKARSSPAAGRNGVSNGRPASTEPRQSTRKVASSSVSNQSAMLKAANGNYGKSKGKTVRLQNEYDLEPDTLISSLNLDEKIEHLLVECSIHTLDDLREATRGDKNYFEEGTDIPVEDFLSFMLARMNQRSKGNNGFQYDFNGQNAKRAHDYDQEQVALEEEAKRNRYVQESLSILRSGKVLTRAMRSVEW